MESADCPVAAQAEFPQESDDLIYTAGVIGVGARSKSSHRLEGAKVIAGFDPLSIDV